MRILWFLSISPEHGIRHGGNLRYINFSKGLLSLGHSVWFVISTLPGTNRGRLRQFLETLKQQNCVSGYFEIESYSYPRIRGKLARLTIHPHVRNWILRSSLAEYKNTARDLITTLSADLCIFSQRSCLPLLTDRRDTAATIIDWCDSFVLSGLREVRLNLKTGEFSKLPSTVNELARACTDEAFYGRYADANIVVSSQDKNCLDRLNRSPHRNHVLHNGVDLPHDISQPVSKDPNRLIFTGVMSFPPNYRAALWFIEKVMPRLIKKNERLKLIVAGQEPTKELLAKNGEHVLVTGYLPDIRTEIAKSSLYVAPLISGSGFKNKVLEAIASGTYVIGTPRAMEFLEPELRALFLTARTAEEFAALIETVLGNRAKFDANLRRAQSLVKNQYAWHHRVKELEGLCTRSAETCLQKKDALPIRLATS